MCKITHNILGYNPFKVEFVNTALGTSVTEQYVVVLTKREIEAQYEYIDFPPNRVQQLIDEQNESELNGLENQGPEC